MCKTVLTYSTVYWTKTFRLECTKMFLEIAKFDLLSPKLTNVFIIEANRKNNLDLLNRFS